MKRILSGVTVIVLLLAAYWASPFLSLRAIATNLESHNTAGLLKEVDLDRLRGSLSGQIMSAYLRVSGKAKRLGPFGSVLATGVVTSLADPLVAQFISPEHLEQLLNGGAISTDFGAISLGKEQFPTISFASALKAWLATNYWFDRVSIALPIDATEAEQYHLQMQVQQWRWKVVGLDLPEELLNRVAKQLAKKFP